VYLTGQNVPMHSAEVVVIGAGAAGLSLACRLGEQGTDGVVLVAAPPGPHAAPERAWCSWGSDSYWADARVRWVVPAAAGAAHLTRTDYPP